MKNILSAVNVGSLLAANMASFNTRLHPSEGPLDVPVDAVTSSIVTLEERSVREPST